METLYFALAFFVYMIIFGFIINSEKIPLESALLKLSLFLVVILLGGSIIKFSRRLAEITGITLPEPFGWTTMICGFFLAIFTFFGYIALNVDRWKKHHQADRLKLN